MIVHRRRESTSEGPAGLRRGDTLAGYRIERVLGTGGMGAVYEATQQSLRRSVALKVIAPRAPIDTTLRNRFRREGPLQAVIEHPHILPVYEAGESHGRLFIAMRLVRGPTLKAIGAGRGLDPRRSMRILGDVAHALDAAHGAGLVHRDIKPQNILVARGDFAYLADFGLSRTADEATLTRSGQLLGSVAYMSPEQVRGERATRASDIYSFACVVYECLVGLVPFPRESDHAVLHAHVSEPPPRPSEIRPELPPRLDGVLGSAMAKAPDARPRSASALVRDVQSALGLEPDDDPATSATDAALDDGDSTDLRPPVESTHRGLRPVWIVTVLLGVLALVVGVVSGYLVTGDNDGTSGSIGVTSAANRAAPARAAADARFGADLNAAFAALNAGKARSEAKLAQAKTAPAEAFALAGLGAAYRKAHAAVVDARTPARARRARAAIGAALTRIAETYRHLQVAAKRRARSGYDAARPLLERREAELTAAIERLRQLGYRLT
jgi:serine/threonine kinase PknH